jgi:hypothetical protein
MLELKDLPPSIQEALKRKGWTYPFTEEMKAQWGRVFEAFVANGKLSAETIEEAWMERRGHPFHKNGQEATDGC